MNWDIDVPMLRNSTILKQLFFCVGLACLLPGIVLALVTWDIMLLYIFGIIFVGVSVLCVLIILVLFSGKNKLRFSMDSDGVVSETREEQAKKGKIISATTVALGVLTLSPAVVGSGMLVGARGVAEGILWKDIKEIKYKPSNHTIMLKQNMTHRIYVFCLPENYTGATEYIKARMSENKDKGESI